MSLRTLALDFSIDDQTASLDVLLGVIPCTARVRRTNSDLDTADDVAGKETAYTSRSKQEAHQKRRSKN